MRRLAVTIVVLTCTALVAAQGLGLHLHLEIGEHGAGPQRAHVQHHLSDQHDHDDEIDASKFELAALWLKSLPPVPLFASPVLLVVTVATTRWPIATAPARHAWRLRWRPPLRAPPLPA